MNVVFSDEYDRITPEMRELMEKAADAALMTEFPQLRDEEPAAVPEIGVTVVDSVEIRELNRDYRDNDSVTDVLSFPQFEDREELLDTLLYDAAEALIGDVVICYEQAEKQASEYGTGLTREMLYLFVHSVMHLFGYDHMDEEDKKIMRSREEEVLSAVGVSRQ